MLSTLTPIDQQSLEDAGMEKSTPGSNSIPFLELDKVSKAYQEGQRTRRVLDEMDLTIQSGEIIAILGKSGSGKSTLLNIISGIDIPASGSVRHQGRDLTALRERERTMFRRSQVGFIFQFFNLIPTLTVWENIVLPLELSGNDNPAGLQRARDLLAEVELADRANTFPDRLSGGEQQRVAIARALVNDPALLLADEPTGNLDVKTGDKVLNLLLQLTRQSDKNMILVTHSREAAKIADRIFRLRGGKLIPYTAAS